MSNATNWLQDLLAQVKTEIRVQYSFQSGTGTGAGLEENRPRSARMSDVIERASRGLEDGHSKMILAIAGGPGWGDSRQAASGLGSAAREARRLADMRGAWPSVTSLDEAAAAAAAAIAVGLTTDPIISRYLRRARARADWGTLPIDAWDWSGFRHWAWRTGCRAAFSSLRRLNNAGTTGEQSDEHAHGLPLDQAAVELAAIDLAAHFAGQSPESHQVDKSARAGRELDYELRAQRGAVGRWIWSAIVDALPTGAGAGNAQKQRTARDRARFLIRLVHGHTLPDAARRAGFASAKSALESLRSGRTMSTLRAAAGSNWDKLPGFALLRQSARAAGVRAGKAVRAFRSVSSINTHSQIGRKLFTQELNERIDAIDQAKATRARVLSARKRQDRAWERATTGWKSGWLHADKSSMN